MVFCWQTDNRYDNNAPIVHVVICAANVAAFSVVRPFGIAAATFFHIKTTLKKPPFESSIVEFPAPNGPPSISSHSPPLSWAYPTGRRVAGTVDIAVPVVITIGGDGDVPIDQAISEAVARLRRCKVQLWEIDPDQEDGDGFLSDIDCMPLANCDQLRLFKVPDSRTRVLAVVSEAVEAVGISLANEAGSDKEMISEAIQEIQGILEILLRSNPSCQVKAS